MRLRRALLAVLAGFLLAPGAALADGWVREPAPAQVVSVGRELDALSVQFEPPRCHWRAPRAAVKETRTSIRIEVSAEGYVGSVLDSCPPPIFRPHLLVSLRHRVGGRRVVVDPRLSQTDYRDNTPRVIDLDYRDAIDVLKAQRLRARLFGAARGRVAFQSPAPGKPAAGGLRVHLTLGHHNFHARALRRCVRRSGVFANAGRPDVGDFDAPDLELSVHGDVRALVALYADPARRDELLPEIRHRARGVTVERAGLATIVWVGEPDAAVRGCAARARP